MDEQTRSVFDTAIATKILQHISRVRDFSHEGIARRWIWELIQNAKDAAFPNEPVKIRVQLTENELIFSHNGRPFGVKGVLSIIYQVSSKMPDNEETTGKFGTGFVTTHLLSEVVKLSSVLSDVDGSTGENLPYKAFTVNLDRSGEDQEQVLAAVNHAVNIIETIDQTPDVDFDKGLHNTSFRYALNDEKSKEIAKFGLDDLKYSIVYMFAFVKNIAEIEIVNELTGENKKFAISSRESINEITKLGVTEEYENKEYLMLVAQKEKSIVVAPIDDEKNFVEIDPNTPRVFADFPLIGSEKFPFPAICNSGEFQPDEPRSFIPITEGSQSVNSNKNKVILLECMQLYRSILDNSAEYSKMHHIVRFGQMPSRPDLYATWIYDNIFVEMLNFLKSLPLIKLSAGEKVRLTNDVYFPMSGDEDEILKIGEILNLIENYTIPKDLSGWYNAFRYMPNLDENQFLTLETIAQKVDSYTLKPEVSRLAFVQKIYDAVIVTPKLLKDLNSGNLALIPDQTEGMTLHTVNDIYKDVDIDDNFKKSINLLNEFTIENKLSLNEMLIYEKLAHKDFDFRGDTAVLDAPMNDYTNYIARKTNIIYSSSDGDYVANAFCQLICCCEDDYWFHFAKVYFLEKMVDKEFQHSQFYSYEVFRKAIMYMMSMLADKIENTRNLEGLESAYFQNGASAVDGLKAFIKKSSDITTKIFEYKIFPNQYGIFKSMHTLSFEGENVSTDLKEIAKKLVSLQVTDYYDTLLFVDLGYFLKSSSVTVTNKDIATSISDAINHVLNQQSLSEAADDVQVASTLLLAWIQNNEDEAKHLVSSFYSEENRMKLLTPKSATILSRQMKEINDLLEQYGVKDIDELDRVLRSIAEENKNTSSGGFTSFESNIDFANEYYAGWGDDQKREYSNRVGVAGEQFAFEQLKQKWIAKGYVATVINAQTVEFVNGDEVVRLFYADTDDYKQKGFDIQETINGQLLNYYEVKSTVVEDRTAYIKLTKAQAENAFTMPERFSVMSMFLTKDLMGLISCTIIDRIVEKIRSQELTVIQDGIILFARGA